MLQLEAGQVLCDMCMAALPCTSQADPDSSSSSKLFLLLAARTHSMSNRLAYEQGLLSVVEIFPARAHSGEQRYTLAHLA